MCRRRGGSAGPADPRAGGATQSWRGVFPLLAAQARVVAVDLPGQGFTQLGARMRCGLDHMAEDLWSLCRYEGWQPAVIVGHSAGAAIALRMAELGACNRCRGRERGAGQFPRRGGLAVPDAGQGAGAVTVHGGSVCGLGHRTIGTEPDPGDRVGHRRRRDRVLPTVGLRPGACGRDTGDDGAVAAERVAAPPSRQSGNCNTGRGRPRPCRAPGDEPRCGQADARGPRGRTAGAWPSGARGRPERIVAIIREAME